MSNVGRLWGIFGTLGGIMLALALALLWLAVGESRLAWGSAATGVGFLANAAFAAKRAGTGADMHLGR